MPYNEELESRIKKFVSRWKGADDKKMFGGVCHLLNGNMFCGIYKDFLILRLGQNRSEEALKLPFARPFDITGKKMNGWVMLDAEGYKSDDELRSWLAEAKKFVKTLPEK
jgi:TfoX/Sxy family transcriptional regulator of competence genes